MPAHPARVLDGQIPSSAAPDPLRSPLVSVVIPTHNRARYLLESVNSVLRQTHRPIEVIVVDDHSTDETDEVLAGVSDRIRVVRNDSNLERGASRNAGARVAKGSMLAFLDSDDLWDAEKLASQIPLLVDENMAVVTAIAMIDQDGRRTGREYYPAPGAERRLPIENAFLGGASSILLPKPLFEAIGGFPEDRDVQGSEDHVFLTKLAAAGARFASVPRPLVSRRVHATNSTADAEAVARSMWAAAAWLEDHAVVDADQLRRLRGRTATMVARQFAATRDWDQAWQWVRRGFATGTRGDAVFAAASVAYSGLRQRASGWPAAPRWLRRYGWRRGPNDLH